MGTYDDYRRAAALLWGEAGDLAAAEFGRLNREHFGGTVPPMPVIIGLAAYGRCLGITRTVEDWLGSPRITLMPEIFNGNHRTRGGPRMLADVLLHEMIHARLMFAGEDPRHNGEPWCRAITRLSPAVLGREITAQPVKPRRVPNPERDHDPKAARTKVVRKPEPGAMTQDQLATWPLSVRPADYYQDQQPIPVPTY